MIKKITPKETALFILLGAALSVGLNAFFYVTALAQKLPGTGQVSALYRFDFFTGFFLYGVCSPLVEELLFRKLLFASLLRKKLSFLPAAALSALIFAAYHLNVLQFCYALLPGFLLALFMEGEQSPAAPMVIHVAMNVTALCLTKANALLFLQEKPVLSWGIFAACMLFTVVLAKRELKNLYGDGSRTAAP